VTMYDFMSIASGLVCGPRPPRLLGHFRTNDHRSKAAAHKRDAIASDGFVDQVRDRRTSECERALQGNPDAACGAMVSVRSNEMRLSCGAL
jgi:hypothetical protein